MLYAVQNRFAAPDFVYFLVSGETVIFNVMGGKRGARFIKNKDTRLLGDGFDDFSELALTSAQASRLAAASPTACISSKSL